MRPDLSLLALVLVLASTAVAQSGTLDQVSPASNAAYNVSDSSLIWQQQVRVGVAGRLEGFELTLTGPMGADLDLRLRQGDGWTTSPVVWAATYSKTTPGTETPFFDATTTPISFVVGETFVIELQGHGTGINLLGSYVNPSDGPPLYFEELYVNGPPCYEDCGWRHGFRTWMLDGSPGESYCTAVTNSTGVPALITASGSASIAANSLTLSAEPVPNQPGLFFYGSLQTIVPFGDGFRCVAGTIGRLPVVSAGGNLMTHAVDYTQPPSGSTVITAGSTWNFQAWFRDPAAGNSGFNLSDACEITFLP